MTTGKFISIESQRLVAKDAPQAIIMDNCKVVDIFCGVGGLTRGFVDEDFDVVAGYDADDSCRYAYEENNDGAAFYQRDISGEDDVDHEEGIAEHVTSQFPEGSTKILVGCAPCQPFSSYSNTKKKSGSKWELVHAFADLIEEVDPDIVSMENVTRLRSFDDGAVFDEFVSRLEDLGHSVYDENVYCPNYGVPQTRWRLVLLSSKLGDIELMDPTHEPEKQTVRKTIEPQPEIACGETHEDDPYHKSSNLSPLNLERIQASNPGGTWEDWDEDLLAACHKRESGQSFKSVYGRMKWDEPGPTITTQFFSFGRGRFGHPKQDRAISIREGALLQTFPPNYNFVKPGEPIYFNSMGRHIGNAVPVKLGRAIAESIRKHVDEHAE